MATTSDLSKGVILKFNGGYHVLEEISHHTPGNKRGFYQAKMRNLLNGRIVENKFRSGETVDIVRTERKAFQFLYADGEDFVMMDKDSFDQLPVSGELVGDKKSLLKEGMDIELVFVEEDTIIEVSLPIFIELVVTETDPSTKDDRATSGTKPATLETGATINVPMFIQNGDLLKIDSRTKAYVERVKK